MGFSSELIFLLFFQFFYFHFLSWYFFVVVIAFVVFWLAAMGHHTPPLSASENEHVNCKIVATFCIKFGWFLKDQMSSITSDFYEDIIQSVQYKTTVIQLEKDLYRKMCKRERFVKTFCHNWRHEIKEIEVIVNSFFIQAVIAIYDMNDQLWRLNLWSTASKNWKNPVEGSASHSKQREGQRERDNNILFNILWVLNIFVLVPAIIVKCLYDSV